MKQLTAFSWGYWGWGSHARELVGVVDAIEHNRGKRPPVFADIRFSRGGRAQGFRDAAFEEAAGKNRYRWLKKLGNARIGSGRGGVKIADPSGVDDLLQLVADADEQRRRVIFSCACECPRHCHRAVVARLLVRSASRKGIPLSVVEWPGQEPITVELAVSKKVVTNVLNGSNRVPLEGDSRANIYKFAALPWGSRVELHSKDSDIGIWPSPVGDALVSPGNRSRQKQEG